jgi:Xaa-Pro aminopeptidase
VAQREIKDELEMSELEKAAAIGYKMHLMSMLMCKPGVFEHDIAGAIEGVALAANGQISFPVILSMNGQTLHNHCHNFKLEAGRLMITDAGAESPMHYASDFTRTIPVGGKFSDRQKEIYNIVVAANDKAHSLAMPGVTYKSVHIEACKVIATGLSELGLMKGDIETAVNQGAHALFMPHGLGHQMGLDVHDMEDLGENYVGYDKPSDRSELFGTAFLRMGKMLKPGMVMTNEPGIYFIPELINLWKSEGKHSDFLNYDAIEKYIDFGGIRLEDDLVITETGNELIGKRLPIYTDEIEDIMS